MGISNNILHHIENFTAQRDKELLAFSLLKSIRDILSPIKATILTVNGQDEPVMEIALNGNESCQYNYQNVQVSENLLASLRYINDWQLEELMEASGAQYTSIHVLKQTRQLSQYLIVAIDTKPSRSESYIIKGMLSIYSNFSSLLAESQTDELTGLMNRKTFDESVVKLYQSSALEESDNNTSNWIAIIDLDHFKMINDTYGHLYGDEVLIHVSRALQQTFRQQDMLFRFGGEEFVVLMRNLDRDSCTNMLKQLQERIHKIAVNQIDMITVSIGVSEFQNDIFHITLMDHADQALYHSKQTGRDKITYYSDIVAAGLAKENTVEAGDIDFF